MVSPSRYWLDKEIGTFAASLRPGSLVLDAGAGNQRYRPKFVDHRYESADFEMVDKKYQPSTYVCDLASIPVEDNRYDAILFSQVMEHLPKPVAVLAELRRVLKPGGTIFCSAPLFYEEHEKPYDFYRYTQFGFRHLFEDAGLRVVETRWLEGFMGTAYLQMRWLAKYMPLSPKALGGGVAGWSMAAILVPLKPILLLLASLAAACDKNNRYTGKGYPSSYVVLALKD